jgi:hypothetical protein
VVNLSPITHDRLHALEDFTLEVNLLWVDDQIRSFEARFGLRSHYRHQWHSTDSPFVGRLSDLLYCDTHGSEAILDQNTCTITIGWCELAIKDRWVRATTLISEVVGHWSKGTLIFAVLLSSG